MPFDPDQYLASRGIAVPTPSSVAPPFDPDHYLATRRPVIVDTAEHNPINLDRFIGRGRQYASPQDNYAPPHDVPDRTYPSGRPDALDDYLTKFDAYQNAPRPTLLLEDPNTPRRSRPSSPRSPRPSRSLPRGWDSADNGTLLPRRTGEGIDSGLASAMAPFDETATLRRPSDSRAPIFQPVAWKMPPVTAALPPETNLSTPAPPYSVSTTSYDPSSPASPASAAQSSEGKADSNGGFKTHWNSFWHDLANTGKVFVSELAKSGYATAQGLEENSNPVALTGRPADASKQDLYDQLTQKLNEIRDENAHEVEGPSGTDPRETEIYHQLAEIDAGTADHRTAAQLWKQDGENSDAEHGVDPALANHPSTKIAKGVAGGAKIAALSAIPFFGMPLVVGQSTLESGATAGNQKENELRAQGITDEAAIRDAIGQARSKAQAWTLATMPLYLLGNAAISKGLKAIIPGDWSALGKFATQFAGQTAGNQTASSLLAAAQAAAEAQDGQRLKSAGNTFGASMTDPETWATNVTFAASGAAVDPLKAAIQRQRAEKLRQQQAGKADQPPARETPVATPASPSKIADLPEETASPYQGEVPVGQARPTSEKAPSDGYPATAADVAHLTGVTEEEVATAMEHATSMGSAMPAFDAMDLLRPPHRQLQREASPSASLAPLSAPDPTRGFTEKWSPPDETGEAPLFGPDPTRGSTETWNSPGESSAADLNTEMKKRKIRQLQSQMIAEATIRKTLQKVQGKTRIMTPDISLEDVTILPPENDIYRPQPPPPSPEPKPAKTIDTNTQPKYDNPDEIQVLRSARDPVTRRTSMVREMVNRAANARHYSREPERSLSHDHQYSGDGKALANERLPNYWSSLGVSFRRRDAEIHRRIAASARLHSDLTKEEQPWKTEKEIAQDFFALFSAGGAIKNPDLAGQVNVLRSMIPSISRDRFTAFQGYDSGGEAIVHLDEEGGIVYKLYKIKKGTMGIHSIGRILRKTNGNIDVNTYGDAPIFPQFLERVARVNAHGNLTPMEFMAVTPDGYAVFAQPFIKGDFAEGADVRNGLEALGLKVLPSTFANSALGKVNGKWVIFDDLHERNIIQTPQGNVEIIDAMNRELTPDEIKDFKKWGFIKE